MCICIYVPSNMLSIIAYSIDKMAYDLLGGEGAWGWQDKHAIVITMTLQSGRYKLDNMTDRQAGK